MDSVESALNAARGGASRLEVCAALAEGGLTPSPGVMAVISTNVTIPCFAMVRPRAGDFVYSELELQAMERDIEVMISCGAVGLVLGCLNTKGDVDREAVTRLVAVSRAKLSTVSLTFHRAIDLARDLSEAAAVVAQLGFERILTSGGRASALEGADTIARLVSELGEAVIVMPGGGVTEDNLEEIRTRTKCVEFHASARVSRASEMEHQNPGLSLGSSGREYTTMVTSRDKVSNLIKIYKVNFFK